MQIDTICLKDGIIPSVHLEYFSLSKKLFIIQSIGGDCTILPLYTVLKDIIAYHSHCILNRALSIQLVNEVSVDNKVWGNCSRQNPLGLSNRKVVYQHNH
jgi:hypothetical protein